MNAFEIDRIASGISISQDELLNAERVIRTNPDGSRLYVEGGFGSLWRAGREGEYAIKCFHRDGLDSARGEFETLSRLNDCPYTPTVYCCGSFTDDNGVSSPALVESFVRGATLQQVIAGGLLSGSIRRGIDARRASLIALEIARALDSIAEYGVAHRDLSSANIMLTESCLSAELKGGVEVVLIDFGQSTRSARVTITARRDSRLAYVPFGAPEVFGGKYRYLRNSSKCDTWSLGAIVVAMMAGEYWPESISDLQYAQILSEEALDRIAEAKRPPLDLVALASLHSPKEEELELADIVRSCTAFNPHLRPTLEGVIATLESYVETTPASVTPQIITPASSLKSRADQDISGVRGSFAVNHGDRPVPNEHIPGGRHEARIVRADTLDESSRSAGISGTDLRAEKSSIAHSAPQSEGRGSGATEGPSGADAVTENVGLGQGDHKTSGHIGARALVNAVSSAAHSSKPGSGYPAKKRRSSMGTINGKSGSAGTDGRLASLGMEGLCSKLIKRYGPVSPKPVIGLEGTVLYVGGANVESHDGWQAIRNPYVYITAQVIRSLSNILKYSGAHPTVVISAGYSDEVRLREMRHIDESAVSGLALVCIPALDGGTPPELEDLAASIGTRIDWSDGYFWLNSSNLVQASLVGLSADAAVITCNNSSIAGVMSRRRKLREELESVCSEPMREGLRKRLDCMSLGVG